MNPYQILGIPENATEAQIKEAYRKKAHECHPDRGGSEEQMKLINQAKMMLSKRCIASRFSGTTQQPDIPTVFVSWGGGLSGVWNVFFER